MSRQQYFMFYNYKLTLFEAEMKKNIFGADVISFTQSFIRL